MVTFYKPQKKTPSKSPIKLECSSLDLIGRGVGRCEGKVYFVKNLMPGECAKVLPDNVKGSAVTASVAALINKSPLRQEADCKALSSCGGCPLQHLPDTMALEAKSEGVRRLFSKVLGMEIGDPTFMFAADSSGYRRACRLSSRQDHGKIRLGFREEKSHELVQINACLVLTKRLNDLLLPLQRQVNDLKSKKSLGHIELLDSDGAVGVLLRFVQPLEVKDEELLKTFAAKYDLVLAVAEPYQNPLAVTKMQSVRERNLYGDPTRLYVISDGIRLNCSASSFVQVNAKVNAFMVKKVVELSQAGPQSRVLDLFCGIGNFSLPLSKSGAKVVGADIVRAMTLQALENAKNAGLDNVNFVTVDLESDFESQLFAKDRCDVAVLDPGRQGARRACKFLAEKKPIKIVMISCNPLAASRDIIELNKAGYKINSWGICDMFPRTSHIEVIVELVLEKR